MRSTNNDAYLNGNDISTPLPTYIATMDDCIINKLSYVHDTIGYNHNRMLEHGTLIEKHVEITMKYLK